MSENTENNVVDFQSKRKDAIEKKKRQFERFLFDDFLGCFAEVDDNGTNFPVKLVNVSETGCKVETPWNPNTHKSLSQMEDLTLRVYFTKKSFIPLVMTIARSEEVVNEDGTVHMQYGCEFDESLPGFQAWKSFVDFIGKYAEFSSFDKGDQKVYFL
jgi:hypothetical protein